MSNSLTVTALNGCIDLVERYTNCVKKNSKNSNEIINLKNLAPYVLYFSNAIEVSKRREDIFDDFMERIDTASEEQDWNSLLKEFNEQIDAVKETIRNPEKSQRYKDYVKLIANNEIEGEEEICTVFQITSSVDPITKLPIVEPVKNKNCGHVYNKSTILEFISKYPETKCPVAGCSAKGFIKKSDLVSDQSFKRILTNASNDNPEKRIKIRE